MTRSYQRLVLSMILLVALSACGEDDHSSSGPSGDPSPGCERTAAEPGRRELELMSGGQLRRYVLYIPRSVAAGVPAPLVLDFPAYSPMQLEEAFSGFTQPDRNGVIKAEEVGAVVVTPEPIGGDGALRAWNLTGRAVGFPDDQRFVADLLVDVGARTCIDRKQILAMGFAVGGVMAALVSCNAEVDIAALVSVAGPYDPPSCARVEPLPVLAYHGTDDPLLPFAGGIGPHVPMLNLGPQTAVGIAGIVPYLVGATRSAQAWSARNGCMGGPETTSVAPTVTHQTWSDCVGNGAVELYVTDGAGHTWPGTLGMDEFVDLLGPTTKAIIANDLIWDFFRAHVHR